MKAWSAVVKMQTNHGIVDTCDRETLESVEEEIMYMGHTGITKDDNDMVSNGVDYGRDLPAIFKFRKYFGGRSELECDEETITPKSEPVENKADLFKHTELQNTGDCNGNFELNHDESKFSETTSIINIIPILDSDTDDDCQIIGHTDGRINTGKTIKLELLESDDATSSIVSIPDMTCAVVEKSSISDPLGSTSANGKPSDLKVNSRTKGKRKSRKKIKLEILESNDEKQLIEDVKCAVLDKRSKSVPLSSTSAKRKPSESRKTGGKKKKKPEKRKRPIYSEVPSVYCGKNLCPVCQAPFAEPLRKSKQFADHLKLHYPELHACKICGQGFTRKDNLERHVAFHKYQSYVPHCHICGVSFKSHLDFTLNASAHMNMHRTKEGGHRPVPEFLTDHAKINEKNALTYTCNICGTAFSYLAPLLTHLAAHSNGGQHSCIICAKECIWEADINMRMCKSHPDICNICGVGNLTPENFDDHRKTHYGTFYNCEICDQGFTWQENLDKHELTAHSRLQNPYTCHLCDEVIALDVRIKQHINGHNRTTFNTFNDGLPNYFTAQIKKKQSKKSGLFACNLCGYASDQVQPLISHLLEHLRSSSACPDCGKEYVGPAELNDHVTQNHVAKNESSVQEDDSA